MKRFASHLLLLPSRKLLKLHVVEIENGCVVRIFPLSEESECVQWMPGICVLLPKEEGDVYCKQPSLLMSEECSLLNNLTLTSNNFAIDVNPELRTMHWCAYRLFPFDFENMCAIELTQITLLE